MGVGWVQIEPSVPATLGLLLINSGAGAATNVVVQSLQPQITSNQKGLLVSFNIVGTVLGSNTCSPAALTANVRMHA